MSIELNYDEYENYEVVHTPPKFFFDYENKCGEFKDANELLEYLNQKFNMLVYSMNTSLPEEEREKTKVNYKIVIKLEEK